MEEILRQAERLEKEYDWLGALELYRIALSKVAERNVLKAGGIHELSGYGFFRAACQADSVEEFKKRLRSSVESYEKAAELFEKIRPPARLYCKAMARYSDSWLVDDASQKRQFLDECWRLLKEAFAGFEASENLLGSLKVFRSLAFCLRARDELVEDWHERERIAQDAVKYSQDAISMLSKGMRPDELAWAYVMAGYSMSAWLDFFDERRAEFVPLISRYMENAAKLAEQTDEAYLAFFRCYTMCLPSDFSKLSLPTGFNLAEEALRHGERSKDHYLIGVGHLIVLIVLNLEATTIEDLEELKEKTSQIIQHAKESISHFLMVCKYGRAAMCYAFITSSQQHLASHESNVGRRRELLEQAVEFGSDGSEYANIAGSAEDMSEVLHSLSSAKRALSRSESNSAEKKKLLEEAANLREKTIKIGNRLNRPEDWGNGVYQYNLALINADLADIEENWEKKKHLLEEAVQDMEKCLRICTEDLSRGHAVPLPSSFGTLGLYHDLFGQVLGQLYSLTRDEKVVDRSVQVYESAAKTFQKAGMPSRVAEAYWKAAKLYDSRGEYPKAADSFERASQYYGIVSGKIQQLRDFYRDHSVYMQAWCEIEKARYNHARQEYGLAKGHFEKAAALHKSLRQWSYLASNYSAWAELSQAEELSRGEKAEEAVKSFENAAKLFTETEDSLRTQLARIENADEKLMATGLVKASAMRSEYCSARIVMEEAKIFDKQGDHLSSSEKYGSAARIFEKINQGLDSERERRELNLVIGLSRAWEKMTLAEAKSSPTLYLEASQLFEQAEDLSPNEKTKMLILAHSRFCRALEAGTRFVDTRNVDTYAESIKYLESAATHYVKAGIPLASEYAEATKLLFDAYLHMDAATRESDPERRAKLYAMAEKVLQTSAGSFLKAEHPEKREQVLGLLERVRKEHDLAMSLTELLHAPAIVSTTASFSMPTPTRENAVGSERFEGADVQANLIVRQKELKVGEQVEVEMEFVNAGKRPALLIKVNEAIPTSFNLVEKSDNCRVEDSHIDMKGRRLDPLKAEEVKLVLRPKVQGAFTLKPTILYLDENGKSRTHEPEPVKITVRELGIKGWLKGER